MRQMKGGEAFVAGSLFAGLSGLGAYTEVRDSWWAKDQVGGGGGTVVFMILFGVPLLAADFSL